VNPAPEVPGADDAQRQRTARFERIRRIAAAIRAGLPEDMTSDHGWLYDDETGLPR
jgi:antitoxin VapB